jgi:hypothetical protein
MDFSCFQGWLMQTSCLFAAIGEKKIQSVHYYSDKRYITDRAPAITIIAKTNAALSANDQYLRIIALNNS